MGWKPLRERLDDLPLVIAGPILRQVSQDAVTVWLALKRSQRVTLKVFDLQGNLKLQGDRKTIQLGQNLHIVAVTATQVTGLLEYGQSYLYDVEFDSGQSLRSPGVINSSGNIADIAYSPYPLPSFTLVPRNLNDVRLVHGSCRKPHGENLDALAGLDKMIREAIQQNPYQRPHQLYLTGDQIYADDVADALLFMLLDAGEALFGWEEVFADVSDRSELRPGRRNRLMTQTAGLTASITKVQTISNAAKSHLLAFREFACMYLFVWSDVLWVEPHDFPSQEEVYALAPDTQRSDFDGEVKELKTFATSLKAVRRSLANLPTYMMFDDHEITDDWYLNFAWCDRILKNTLGVQLIQNGLLAYALFQAWGNTPEQFESQKPGGALIAATEAWCALSGNNDTCSQEIRDRLGIPHLDDIRNSQPRRLPVVSGALQWHYTVLTPSFQTIVLDTRTQRTFPGLDFDFPGLISEEGCQQQLANLKMASHVELTLIISPSPVIGLPFLETIQRTAKNISEKLGAAAWAFDPEAWGLQTANFEEFLKKLVKGMGRNSRVVILSGDVHYSFAARMQYAISQVINHHRRINTQMVVAQFTSSSLKNEDSSLGGSHALHYKGFIPVEKIKHIPKSKILGWENPDGGKFKIGRTWNFHDGGMETHPWVIKGNPAMINLECDRAWFRVLEIFQHPQWWYRIDFLPANIEPVEPTPNQQTSVIAPLPKQPRTPSLAKYLGNAKQHLTKNQEIVGVNNFGEITFEFNQTKQIATQTLWWSLESRHPSTPPELFPISQFDVSLSFDDGEYPFQDLLREVVIP